MASSNNLDTLSQDGELPFGHPGRRFDDTPEGFEPSPLVDQGPELDYTPDEDGRVVHYGPGDRPLCGNDSVTAVYTDDPALVSGCRDCLELVAEDPGDDNEYMGHCLHCRHSSPPRAVRSGAASPRAPCYCAAARSKLSVSNRPRMSWSSTSTGQPYAAATAASRVL